MNKSSHPHPGSSARVENATKRPLPSIPTEMEGNAAREEDYTCKTSQTWSEIVQTLDSLDAELREAFMEDANKCVDSIESSLLRSTGAVPTNATNTTVCRELHNLKGVSASVGLEKLATILHRLEENFDYQDSSINESNSCELFDTIDQLRDVLALKTPKDAAAHLNAPDSIQKVDPLINGTMGRVNPMARVETSKLDRLMDRLAQLVMLRNRRDTEIQFLASMIRELSTTASKIRSLGANLTDLGQLDDASYASEIANDINEIHRSLHLGTQPLVDGNASVNAFISDFRQELTSLRRTPLRGLAQRLHRAVIDAAKEENKDVEFLFIGEEERLETHLQQQLVDALIHVCRNAVCHGVERPAERERVGKSVRGQITVRVVASPESLLFEVTDDGKGLDFQSIQSKAIQLGLIQKNQRLSREDLAQFILRPGFTTRDSINTIAGRGIGLDIVASDMEKMRGWVDISSEANTGTTIRLNVPLPSLIQHILIFSEHNQTFGIPMHHVQLAGQCNPELPTYSLSGERIPMPADPSPAAVIVDLTAYHAFKQSSDLPERFNLLVERIVGPEEMVVQQLPEIVKGHPYLDGITLAGSGETVLIVNPYQLLNSQYHSRDIRGNKLPDPTHLIGSTGSMESSPRVPSPEAPPTALLISDSISTRSVLKRCLSQVGYNVIEISNSNEASTFLRSKTAELLIFDEGCRMDQIIDPLRIDAKSPNLAATNFLAIGKVERKDLPLVSNPPKHFLHLPRPVTPEDVLTALGELDRTTKRENEPELETENSCRTSIGSLTSPRQNMRASE